MAESGVVTEVHVDEQGSELAADLTIGDALVYVEDAQDYDSAGGFVYINRLPMEYVGTDVDADTLILNSFLATVSGVVGDRVSILSAGEIAYDWTLEVHLSDGNPVYIPIAFGDRPLWKPGPVIPPIPVTVSDDLTTVVDVPGRTPQIDFGFTRSVNAAAFMPAALTIPDGVGSWTRVTDWQASSVDVALDFDETADQFVCVNPGVYLVIGTIWWDVNTTGRRGLRIGLADDDFTYTNGTEIRHDAASTVQSMQITQVVTSPSPNLYVYLEVQQNSGGSLDILGSSLMARSTFTVTWLGQP